MRNKSIKVAAAIVSAVTLSLGMGILPASATGFSNVEVCNIQSPSLCMNGYDGNGGAVKADYLNPGSDPQVVDVTPLSNCGGTVTYSCPFKLGSGLNTQYYGDSIVSITNVANDMTYRSDSSGDGMVEAAGGGNGQVWVQNDDLGGSHPGAQLINVYASDLLGNSAWACTEGQGSQIAVSTTYQGANCAWQAVGS
jgi:hypothetical protein